MATQDSISALTSTARDLSKRVAAMDRDATDRTQVLARQVRRSRTMLRWLVAAAVFELVLAALVTVALCGVESNTQRLDTQTTVSRQKALCPLYQLLIERDTKRARDVATDKAAYDRAYVVIREGYSALECGGFSGGAPNLGVKE